MLNKIRTLLPDSKEKNKIKLSVKNLDDFKYFNAAQKLFIHFKRIHENCHPRLIGGSVRKLIEGEKIDDMDIAINLQPDEIKKILIEEKIKFLETGIKHGTITVLIDHFKFEITSLRKDIDTDGRHAKVEFTSDWKEDALRRDFTINAIYCDISGEVYDPLNGIEDLNKGIIKFIGNPNERIQEDYLRILRYVRFFVQYSKNQFHDEATESVIKKNLNGIAKLSKERTLDELFKMMKLNNFSKLFQDQFCRFIILSIFPQLKNYERIKILDKISSKIYQRIDKVLLLSILLIDETDSCNFFLYKYPISNEIKKRILFMNDNIKNYSKDYFYSKKNLLKLSYYNGKSMAIDFMILLIFIDSKKISKIQNLIEFIQEFQMPKFPINATFLKEEFYFVDGKELGNALKKLEEYWINNNFKIEKENIKKILNIK